MKTCTDLSITARRSGHAWSPGLLFGSGVSGLWFDPAEAPSVWGDPAGTTPLLQPGGTVGRMDSRGDLVLAATQLTAAARPVWARVPARGRRNMLRHTEDLSNVQWTKASGATVQTSASISPEDQPAQRITFLGGSPNSMVVQVLSTPAPAPGMHSFWVRSDVSTTVRLRVMVNGSSVAVPVQSVTPTWTRVELQRGAEGDVINAVGVQNNAAGDSAPVEIAAHQFEIGTTRSPYQYVGSEYDVTEPGSPSLWHLLDDGVDDSLTATPGAPMTDATLWWVSDAGISILAGQSIPTAPLEVLRGTRTFVFGAFARPLSGPETEALTRYLMAKGGSYA